MRHIDLVNAIETLVDSTCADSVKDALAAVCAAKGRQSECGLARTWRELADLINKVPNLGV